MMQPQAADSLRDRLAAAHAAIEGLKASIEVRRVKLANGGLSSVLAERPVPLRPLGPAPRQLSVLDGHFNKVYSVDWAGDGQRLVSASQDAKLLIWNAVTHRRLQGACLSLARGTERFGGWTSLAHSGPRCSPAWWHSLTAWPRRALRLYPRSLALALAARSHPLCPFP